MILDLNAKRAARAAQRGEAMQMLLGEETFDLAMELPVDVGEIAAGGDLAGALRAMLARPDTDWDRLKACRPSVNDVLDVVEFYGASLGESLRSSTNSTITGPPSKSTSTATTAAALPRPATDEPDWMPDVSPSTSDTSPQTVPTAAS